MGIFVPTEVIGTVRILINYKARTVMRLALESMLEGTGIREGLDQWRMEFRRWKVSISTAANTSAALYPASGGTHGD